MPSGRLPPRSPLDPTAYPHLVDHIISLAERSALTVLRATSRTMRDRCDARLAMHVAIHPGDYYQEDPNAEYILGLASPNDERIVGLGEPLEDSSSDIGILTVTDGVPEAVGRMLGRVQVLDIHAPLRGMDVLAPFLTRLDVVRLISHDRKDIWEAFKLAAAPRTLIQNVNLGHTTEYNWVDGLYTYRDGPLTVEPQLYVPEGVEILILKVQAYRHQDHHRTIPWRPSDDTHPSTLRDIVVNFSCSRDKHEVKDLVCTLIDSVFSARHFCDHLGDVKYTFLVSHSALELFRSVAADHISQILATESNLDDNAVKQAIGTGVDFLTFDEYAHRVGWRRWLLVQNDSYDVSHIKDNGWIVTPHQAFTVQTSSLEDAFLAQTQVFSCGGTIPLDDLPDLALFVHEASGATFRVSVPISVEAAKALYDVGRPSPFGRGDQLAYDESYRSAHELKPPDFAFTRDPVYHTSLLRAVAHSMDLSKPLRATLAKLNMYTQGGFFKAHQDTPRGENHIGTITLCLPSAFTGGALVVRHNGQIVTYDWAGKAGVSWAFLYPDCEHEVLPVTSGTRITVAYDVFIETDTVRGTEAGCSEVLAPLTAALDDPFFLMDGGVLAFGLQHAYPRGIKPGRSGDTAFMSTLKGSDAVWAATFAAAGLPHEVVAVYHIYEKHYIKFGNPMFPALKQSYKNRIMFCHRTFDFFTGVSTEDMSLEEFAKGHGVPAAEGRTVHWVTLPGRYGMRNDYISYGNEDVIYVAAALYVYVGPPGQRQLDDTVFGGDNGDSGMVHEDFAGDDNIDGTHDGDYSDEYDDSEEASED